MFSRRYLDLTDSIALVIRESPAVSHAPPKRMREDSVKAIWMEQPWGSTPIRDVGGKRIEIISPGILNGGPGPDFRDAIFRHDNGAAEKGDVEIHVRSSDWIRHRHHADPAYNNTKLHVVLYCDVSDAKRKKSGGTLIEIELAPVCVAALERIRTESMLSPGQMDVNMVTGRCGDALSRMDHERVEKLIEAAGEGRATLKSKRYHEALTSGKGEDELYRGVLEALGYSAFKLPFGRLANYASLRVLREVMAGVERKRRPSVLQAALFGIAGLIPDATVMRGADEESEKYVEGLWATWKELGQSFNLSSAMTADEWRLKGSRPANYPFGRLAGLAHFLALHVDGNMETLFLRQMEDYPLHSAVKDRKNRVLSISRLFDGKDDEYWARRYTFGGKKLSSSRKLVGPDRVELIIINVIIPFMLARARINKNTADEERLLRVYHAIPHSPPNSVVKFMTDRLSKAAPASAFDNSTVKQQGLTQIYADFCMVNEKGCLSCRFAVYAEKLAESEKNGHII